jgi:hypothetical protein
MFVSSELCVREMNWEPKFISSYNVRKYELFVTSKLVSRSSLVVILHCFPRVSVLNSVVCIITSSHPSWPQVQLMLRSRYHYPNNSLYTDRISSSCNIAPSFRSLTRVLCFQTLVSLFCPRINRPAPTPMQNDEQILFTFTFAVLESRQDYSTSCTEQKETFLECIVLLILS